MSGCLAIMNCDDHWLISHVSKHPDFQVLSLKTAYYISYYLLLVYYLSYFILFALQITSSFSTFTQGNKGRVHFRISSTKSLVFCYFYYIDECFYTTRQKTPLSDLRWYKDSFPISYFRLVDGCQLTIVYSIVPVNEYRIC